MSLFCDNEDENNFAEFAAESLRLSEAEDEAKDSAFDADLSNCVDFAADALALDMQGENQTQASSETAEAAEAADAVLDDDHLDPSVYARELDEVNYIDDREAVEENMRRMMGFREFDGTTDETEKESIGRWVDDRTKGITGEKAREKAESQLRGVYKLVFEDLIPKMHAFFKDNPVQAKELRTGPGSTGDSFIYVASFELQQLTTVLFHAHRLWCPSGCKTGQTSVCVTGRVKPQVDHMIKYDKIPEGTPLTHVSRVLYSADEVKKVFDDPSLAGLVDMVLQLGIPALGSHPAREDRVRSQTMRLLLEAGVAACHDGYTRAVLDWLLILVPDEIDKMLECPVFDEHVISLLRRIKRIYPIFTWTTVPSWLLTHLNSEGCEFDDYEKELLREMLKNTKENGFMHLDLFLRNFCDSGDRIQDF